MHGRLGEITRIGVASHDSSFTQPTTVYLHVHIKHLSLDHLMKVLPSINEPLPSFVKAMPAEQNIPWIGDFGVKVLADHQNLAGLQHTITCVL